MAASESRKHEKTMDLFQERERYFLDHTKEIAKQMKDHSAEIAMHMKEIALACCTRPAGEARVEPVTPTPTPRSATCDLQVEPSLGRFDSWDNARLCSWLESLNTPPSIVTEVRKSGFTGYAFRFLDHAKLEAFFGFDERASFLVMKSLETIPK